jgi:hypothetical protein
MKSRVRYITGGLPPSNRLTSSIYFKDNTHGGGIPRSTNKVVRSPAQTGNKRNSVKLP